MAIVLAPLVLIIGLIVGFSRTLQLKLRRFVFESQALTENVACEVSEHEVERPRILIGHRPARISRRQSGWPRESPAPRMLAARSRFSDVRAGPTVVPRNRACFVGNEFASGRFDLNPNGLTVIGEYRDHQSCP